MDLIGIVVVAGLALAGAFGYYLYRKKAKISKETLSSDFSDYTEKAADSIKSRVNRIKAK